MESITVITNGESKSRTFQKKDVSCDPNDEKVLKEVGLVDLVFPSFGDYGPVRNAAVSFEDKLREFVHYQPLTSHKAPDIPEAIKVCSPEGKRMLKEALATPYMEAYYTVSPQIDNQPEFCCGTMSLVVALNTLDIDPARATWNEEWRWNHLGSLTCCSPILQNPNICLDQFACLAVCNDMRAFTRMATDSWTLHDFRCWVKMALSRPDVVMVVNHGRREMNQEGSGHFLPMTGYHEGRDMILSYDIAKHKYVPQWFPLGIMFKSVRARDDRRPDLNRGFSLLMRPDYETSERLFGLSMAFRIDDVPGKMDPGLESFVEGWNRALNESIPKHRTHVETLKSTILNLLSAAKSFSNDDATATPTLSILELTLRCFKNNYPITSNGSRSSSIIARCRRPQCPSSCPNTLFRHQIESTDIFQTVREAVKSLDEKQRAQMLELVVAQLDDIDSAVKFAKETSQNASSMMRTVEFFKELNCNSVQTNTHDVNGFQAKYTQNVQCPGYIELFPEHIAAFVLLSWPYYSHDYENVFGHDDFAAILNGYTLPHLDDLKIGPAMKIDFDKTIRDGNCNTAFIKSTKTDAKESIRDYLNQVIRHDLEKCQNYRVLNEQIKGINRKLTTVLHYHNLQPFASGL